MKPEVQIKKVEVVFFRGDWVIQWHDGSVTVKASAEDAITEVKKANQRQAKKNPSAVAVFVIDWFNTPPDWTPPK